MFQYLANLEFMINENFFETIIILWKNYRGFYFFPIIFSELKSKHPPLARRWRSCAASSAESGTGWARGTRGPSDTEGTVMLL